MGYLAILKLVLQIANLLANMAREKQLLDAGRDQEIAGALARIATSAGVARQLEAEVAAWTDKQVDDALTGDAR